MHTALGPGVEFDMVRSIWRRLGDRVAASGDDCAFFEVDGAQLAISSDLALEGTHFQVGWLSLLEIGWRAATAAFSDLAAVAANPLGVMASLGISEEQPLDAAAEVMQGIADAAAAVGAVVWGGDIVRGDRLVIDATVVGRLGGETEPVVRSGAEAGHGLYVTGALGGPAAALAAWLGHREPDASARERFAHPAARVAEGRWLRGRGARAMIDLSDGLLADAGHLAAASEVACGLELDAVPVHASAPGPEAATVSGEEYELLVALPDADSLGPDFAAEFGVALTRVGRVESGSGVRVMRGGEVVSGGGLEVFRQF